MPIVQEPNGMPGMGSSVQPDSQNLGGQGSEVSYSGNPPKDSIKSSGVGGILRHLGIGGKNADPPPLAPTTPTIQQGAPEGVTSPDFAARLGLDEGADKASVAAPFMGDPSVPAGPNPSLPPEGVAHSPNSPQEPQMKVNDDLGGSVTEGSVASIGEPAIGSSTPGIAETPTSVPVGTTPDMGGPAIGPEVQESSTKPGSDSNTDTTSKGEGVTYNELRFDLLEELRKSLETAEEAIKGAKETAGKLGIESSDVSANTSGTPPAEALKEPEPVGA